MSERERLSERERERLCERECVCERARQIECVCVFVCVRERERARERGRERERKREREKERERACKHATARQRCSQGAFVAGASLENCVQEILILLPNNQRQHRTLHIQKEVLRTLLVTVPHVSRPCEHFPDGFNLHFLHLCSTPPSARWSRRGTDALIERVESWACWPLIAIMVT